MAGKVTVGTSELATMLGISRQRVNELGRQGKISRATDGRWDVAAVSAALGKNLDGRQQSPARERALGVPSSDRKPGRQVKARHGTGRRKRDKAAGSEADPVEPRKGTLLYEQWRLTREKADREALDRQTLEGSLLKRTEVREAVSAMIIGAKSKLLTIGDELGDRLASCSDAVACREMVESRIHQALGELVEYPACA